MRAVPEALQRLSHAEHAVASGAPDAREIDNHRDDLLGLAGLMNYLALGADHQRAAVRQLACAVDVDKVALVGDRAGARC